MSRVWCGIVAGAIGVAAGGVAAAVTSRITAHSEPRIFWLVFFAAGSAVLAFADWLGVLSTPYTRPPLDLRGSPDPEDPASHRVGQIEPNDTSRAAKLER